MVLELDPGDAEDVDRLQMALERRTARNLRTAWEEMRSALFPDDYENMANADVDAMRAYQEFVRNQQLRDAISRAVQDAADLGVTVGIDLLESTGFGFDWTMAHTHAREWALAHTDEVLAQLATTTRRGVGQAVGRWIDNGEPLQNLIDDLEPLFGKKRAELVSRTEVTRAFTEGNRNAFRESGVVQYWSWQTKNDERVCPVCGPLNGKPVKIGEDFRGHLPDEVASRIAEPIDGPPAHPGCRCGVAPMLGDEYVPGKVS